MRTIPILLAVSLAFPAFAQDRRPSHCIAVAQAIPGASLIRKAAWTDPVPDYSVRIGYIGHSMFLIQTQGGLSAVTDYNGFIGSTDFAPDIVTMNHAHSSHWSRDPDPRIEHVLRGWGTWGVGADHHLDLGEMLVRNVPTDIRSAFTGETEPKGNSIFVFEVEGLCIGHLGHLHHEPDEHQYAALGRLDVVMAAVDGGMTVNTETMIRILKRLRSSIVLPMHWFGDGTLQAFAAGMSDEFDVEWLDQSDMVVSLATLPRRPTIRILRPRPLR